ncbi:nucleotidyltransferase family protein [Methanolobus tindarius DSM 2278]|jgi:predicted nucleotidyltransferase|uniref:Nucleotidyltransferase family protein n=1 Tax=Methanolobus tindarius DSM 2278 TaxID=1090322 RepID=W9DSQ1_METTI|nr:nucleotidyltransferase domain-containing protein [Methanolobus tindarius]ETA68635.1 nucleotidyltransferase family protein [Methanolobus tindarius DSM 2278]
MSFDIDTWMKEYLEKVKSRFGSRLVFVGLQGSRGRGEASESSDIDAVIILDRVDVQDLKAYSAVLDTLPNRELACGFISGRQELVNWEKSDLFQLYHDTIPIYGNIDFLLKTIKKEDIHRAVRIGACNIYHMCGHNMVHAKNKEMLKFLYKVAAFIIQAIHYDQTGTYVKLKKELIPVLGSQEREILQTGIMVKTQPSVVQTEFESLSELLFNWAAEVIIEYQVDLIE